METLAHEKQDYEGKDTANCHTTGSMSAQIMDREVDTLRSSPPQLFLFRSVHGVGFCDRYMVYNFFLRVVSNRNGRQGAETSDAARPGICAVTLTLRASNSCSSDLFVLGDGKGGGYVWLQTVAGELRVK